MKLPIFKYSDAGCDKISILKLKHSTKGTGWLFITTKTDLNGLASGVLQGIEKEIDKILEQLEIE